VDFIKLYLTEATMVIAAARTPGKKAPLLVDKDSLSRLPPNAVVVDLAISNGGNVAESEHDQIINKANGVSIINVSGYPKAEPRESSEVYAQCVLSLLTEIMSSEGDILFENELVQEIWVTHEGQRHDSLYEKFDESDSKFK
jgi:NAD/NADP transhydrogenase alpha subunit